MSEEKQKRIAVLAGNFREFNYFAKGNPIYIYATCSDPDRIRGLEFTDVITVGTWYEDEKANDMLKEIKIRIKN